ncbi:hypothetical protein HBB16_17325 [Pseudonocardia sp. MCCB 268]|nr:hypothetical protein [Pseudonocardia cytotoxica]
MAFATFADARSGAAVIEVGLGSGGIPLYVADADVYVVHCRSASSHAGSTSATTSRHRPGEGGISSKEGSVAVLTAQDRKVAEVLIERCAGSAPRSPGGAEFGVREREVAVGRQRRWTCRACPAATTVFLPRCTASTRRRTRRSRSPARALVGAGTAQPLDGRRPDPR